MMPSPTNVLPTGFEVDEGALTLRFERTLSASPRQVFDAWTKPDQLTMWWDANGEKLSRCEVDLRVGGSYLFASPSHAHMPFTGTYTAIEPPHLIEFDAMGAIGRVEIKEDGAKTRLVVEIVSPSEEHFAHFVKVGVAHGTAQTLDNLVAFLGA
jgi:uncharacterized protein YndB with AHSA1/START domain